LYNCSSMSSTSPSAVSFRLLTDTSTLFWNCAQKTVFCTSHSVMVSCKWTRLCSTSAAKAIEEDKILPVSVGATSSYCACKSLRVDLITSILFSFQSYDSSVTSGCRLSTFLFTSGLVPPPEESVVNVCSKTSPSFIGNTNRLSFTWPEGCATPSSISEDPWAMFSSFITKRNSATAFFLFKRL